MQNALAAISEVEASQGQSLATVQMLLNYESSSALSGLGSPEANFQTAGQTLQASAAQLLQLLASIGPWCLPMLAVLLLRWIIHGRAIAPPPNRAARKAIMTTPTPARAPAIAT